MFTIVFATAHRRQNQSKKCSMFTIDFATTQRRQNQTRKTTVLSHTLQPCPAKPSPECSDCVACDAPQMRWPTGLVGKGKVLVDAVGANEAGLPSIASSRHTSRARVTDCMTAFSNCGSLRGSLLVSSTLLSIIRLAFVEASLRHPHLRSHACNAI